MNMQGKVRAETIGRAKMSSKREQGKARAANSSKRDHGKAIKSGAPRPAREAGATREQEVQQDQQEQLLQDLC